VYDKKTSGILMAMPVPTYAGDSAPTGNVGDMSNYGVEFELTYRDQIGDLLWHVSANATYVRNKLTYLGDESTYLTGSSHKIRNPHAGYRRNALPLFLRMEDRRYFPES